MLLSRELRKVISGFSLLPFLCSWSKGNKREPEIKLNKWHTLLESVPRRTVCVVVDVNCVAVVMDGTV